MDTLPAPNPAMGRTVRFNDRDDHEAPEPWEWPATQADFDELSTRRFERLPHRPVTAAEVPPTALATLRPVMGDLGLDQLFVMPRMVRMAGEEAAHWVVTPTQVLAVTPDRLAIWLDDRVGGHVRAAMQVEDVMGMLDRTVLLHGRLELVGRDTSIIVRYNTVGRSDIRALLGHVRAAATPVLEPLPGAAGRDPMSLPHKWMALIRSADVQPGGRGTVVVAAGDLAAPKPLLHNGVAALTARELIVATDPTPDVRQAQYGFDLVVVPRTRVRAIDGTAATLGVTVDAWPGAVRLEVAAHPSLVAEAAAVLGPLVTVGRA